MTELEIVLWICGASLYIFLLVSVIIFNKDIKTLAKELKEENDKH